MFLYWDLDLLGYDICCVSWCGHLVPPLLSKCFVLWLLLPLVVNQKNSACFQSWGYFGFRVQTLIGPRSEILFVTLDGVDNRVIGEGT